MSEILGGRRVLGCAAERSPENHSVIASIAFRNFKALRQASIALEPFNLVIGPNGSGKSSLIESLIQLRTLARLPLAAPREEAATRVDGPEVSFRFRPPYEAWEAVMSCSSETVCDLLQAIPLPSGAGVDDWEGLRSRLLRIRRFELNHTAIALADTSVGNNDFANDGGNVTSVLRRWHETGLPAYDTWKEDVLRLLPEYDEVVWTNSSQGVFRLALRLRGEATRVGLPDLSQGTLYALALLALSHDPDPPSIIGIEELDRGLHPRMLREIRDAMYRLTHPQASGLDRAPVQVIATTHSPYLLDLFREHPEEIIISEKLGPAARFFHLSDRADLSELMEGATLGDLWYTGLLGGVPDSSRSYSVSGGKPQ